MTLRTGHILLLSAGLFFGMAAGLRGDDNDPGDYESILVGDVSFTAWQLSLEDSLRILFISREIPVAVIGTPDMKVMGDPQPKQTIIQMEGATLAELMNEINERLGIEWRLLGDLLVVGNEFAAGEIDIPPAFADIRISDIKPEETRRSDHRGGYWYIRDYFDNITEMAKRRDPSLADFNIKLDFGEGRADKHGSMIGWDQNFLRRIPFIEPILKSENLTLDNLIRRVCLIGGFSCEVVDANTLKISAYRPPWWDDWEAPPAPPLIEIPQGGAPGNRNWRADDIEVAVYLRRADGRERRVSKNHYDVRKNLSTPVYRIVYSEKSLRDAGGSNWGFGGDSVASEDRSTARRWGVFFKGRHLPDINAGISVLIRLLSPEDKKLAEMEFPVSDGREYIFMVDGISPGRTLPPPSWD